MTTTPPTPTIEETGATSVTDSGDEVQEVVLQRLVLPEDDDGSTLPLYVEPSPGVNPDLVLGRQRLTIPAATRLSFATYFNAFPASYWRRWTVATDVELRVDVTGAATVTVYRSNSRGNPQRITSAATGGFSEQLRFPLSLANFGDGGWYWFDVVAGHRDAVLEGARWVTRTPVSPRRSVTIGITTFNRPGSCVELLESLGTSEETLERIDRILVVDQGSDLVESHPGFEDARRRTGQRVEVIRQPNLGGSGGFARSMHEAAHRGDSDYVLLLDDDVLVEPEGLLRGLAFAGLARRTTIVGGHMFNMHIPSMLHSFGERVNKYRFMWGPAPYVEEAHDFATKTLRKTEWLHRRIDVDYNGWWMCLLPTSVVREVGLSLPIFIKWDDAEYGLRASDHGYPTVSFPGMAVWHVPWTDKDDTIDWQAYYHARNRVLMALLHSPYPRGGSLLRESLQIQLKHALAMEYSAAELRLWALQDILSGPEHLHRTLPTRLGDVRAFRGAQDDAIVVKDPQGFPPARRPKPPTRGKDPTEPRGAVGRATTAAAGALRQALPVRPRSRTHPEALVAALDARWWLLSQFDSAVVSTADGSGASWYKRDRGRFANLLQRSLMAHRQLAWRWNELAEQYRSAVPYVTSPETWERTWAGSGRRS